MSETKIYRVREGVEWVNAARVPADRLVKLTEAEARFDLEQGRIVLDQANDPSATITAEMARTKSKAALVDEQIAAVEESIARGARPSKKRFNLSDYDDGRD